MALPSSGTIKLSDIKTEFGGASPPNTLTSYLRGGTVPNITPNVNIPTAVPINLTDFYGATGVDNEYTMTVGVSGGYYGLFTSNGSLATVKNTLSPWGTIYTLNYFSGTISLFVLSGATVLSKSAFGTMQVVPGNSFTSASSTYQVTGLPNAYSGVWTWSGTNVFGTVAGATRKIYFY